MDTDDTGQQAYELRTGGHPWHVVQRELGLRSRSTAITLALKWANAQGLFWPPRPPEQAASVLSRRRSGDTRQKQQLGYELRSEGWDWAIVAKQVGYASASSCCSTIREWAMGAGLPWPPPRIGLPSSQAAILLRCLQDRCAEAGTTDLAQWILTGTPAPGRWPAPKLTFHEATELRLAIQWLQLAALLDGEPDREDEGP